MIQPTLTVSVHELAGQVRLTVAGELERSSVRELEAALASVESARPGLIELELSGLSFIDAGGLRAILDAARRASEHDRRVIVANPSTPVRRLFAATAVEDVGLTWVDQGGG